MAMKHRLPLFQHVIRGGGWFRTLSRWTSMCIVLRKGERSRNC